MEMTGEYKIPAPRAKVWDALNDPEILAKCIPGCQELNKDTDTELSAIVKSKVGPVSATFKGKVTLSEIDAPNGYRISGEGSGGVAGFAKGGAKIELIDDPDGTLLTYVADAQVGGKLAQIGSRLIDSTAKKMAGEFFGKFVEEVGLPQSSGDDGDEVNSTSEDPAGHDTEKPREPQSGDPKGQERGLSPAVWVGGLIAVVVVVLLVVAG
ncbi:MAG: carbon monoxide dehydrogenase subunit G [Pseudomonadota bacterium]|nr:carbon monoxide dehydrogenase subunit G [Pseudomonadota bacterium]